MDFRFYGGVDEIGGNRIEVSSGDDKIFLDFGKRFNIEGQYFDEFLQPRGFSGLWDLMELNALPNIQGIYREDQIRNAGLSYENEPVTSGILLSHSHLDHAGCLHYIRHDIPFYMTIESYLILKSLQDIGTGSNDYLYYRPKFQFRQRERRTGSGTTHTRARDKIERPIKILEPYRKDDAGEFTVTALPVDHSIPGSCAYLVEADDAMVYTGDLRFRGRRDQDSRKFVKKARRFSPNIMITEGTRIDRENRTFEHDIEDRAAEIATHHRDLVIVNYPIRDLDRFLTFYRVAERSDRIMVVGLKQAYILKLFEGRGYPNLDEVAVYIPRRNWGLIGEDSFVCFDGDWVPTSALESVYIEGDYRTWEREFLELENTVTCSDLRQDPDSYLFQCDYFEFKEFIDIKPEKAAYIKSKTEPFNEEMEIDAERERNWLNHFGISQYTGFHSSGHAGGSEIIEMIREIEPQAIYPVHTTNRPAFKTFKEDGIRVMDPSMSQ